MMKILLVVLFVAMVVVLGFFVVKYGNFPDGKTEETWDIPVTQSDIGGTWGTTIQVEFEDGSIETLNDAFALSISFNDRKVSTFKYILYSKVSSDVEETVDLDLTNFFIASLVTDQIDGLGTEMGDDIVTVNVNDEWKEVYRIIVSEDELDSLELDNVYNLSFIPSGMIKYRGATEEEWNNVPPPGSYWLNFRVKEFVIPPDDPPSDPPGEGEGQWIEIVIGGEVG